MPKSFPHTRGGDPYSDQVTDACGDCDGGGSTEAPFFFERRMDMPANKINDGSIVLIGKAMQQG